MSTLEDWNIEESVRSLGRLFSSPASASCPLWGLFFFAENGELHFIHFHQENWFTRIAGERSSSLAAGEEEIHLVFKKEEQLSLKQVPFSGFFKGLLRPLPLFHLIMKDAPEEKVIFELEDPGEDFLHILIKP